jgi:hypothetical protein
LETKPPTARRIWALVSGVLLPVILSGCGFDASGECAPHHEATVTAPDSRHVAQRWVSICGFPGSTVTDLVSVTDGPITQPPWNGVFAFNEDQGEGSRDQISVSWVDGRHLRITVDAVGDVRDSPHQVGEVTITYVLGPGVDLNAVRVQKDAKIDERRQWERLKTSAAWHYVESSYSFDAYLIEHYQKFIDWARDNTQPRP